ncbi:hypothetical protein [Streptomyces lancefieldiae]|uniref:Uncharacterized protein n=1 Tax=Streptomyces lancefieldiae TaxID=3075520 RepID=A0ABU3AND1_9ACTN|nr:hypothetical protein [Streptomyces sp. DSM 40712]MDT0611478.1 hypothetical protein [Streptomyces sp. DSM 40712]
MTDGVYAGHPAPGVRSLDDLLLLPNLMRFRGTDDFWPPEVLRERGKATDG